VAAYRVIGDGSGYGVRRALRSERLNFKCFKVKFYIVHLLVNN